MKLRAKTILILSATIILASASIVAVSRFFYDRSLEDIEVREARDAVRRSAALVEDDLAQLDVLVRDWAFWDDTWNYVIDHGTEYLETNLGTEASIGLLELSSLIILDLKGGIVFENALDPDWLDDIGASFRGAAPPFRTGVRGLVHSGETIHLLASRPILRSDGSGSANGTLVMTRLVDEALTARYSRLSGFDVSIRPHSEEGPAGVPGKPGVRVYPDEGISVEPGRNSILATLVLGSPINRDKIDIVISMNRAAERYSTSSLIVFLSTIMLVIVVVGMVAVFLFEAAVLGRMRGLGRDLERITASGSTELRLPEAGNDELFILEKTMNKTLDALYGMIGERDAALREIHHRVKNNLQVIASLLSLQSARAQDLGTAQALQESRRRVLAMAFVHEELYAEKELERIDVKRLLERLVVAIGQLYAACEKVMTTVESAGITLGMDQAIPLGLIASELLSNAYRHAFRDGRPGKIDISVSASAGGGFKFRVSDDGIGFVEGSGRGLGLEIVEVLAGQLRAVSRLESSLEGGTIFTLEVRG